MLPTNNPIEVCLAKLNPENLVNELFCVLKIPDPVKPLTPSFSFRTPYWKLIVFDRFDKSNIRV